MVRLQRGTYPSDGGNDYAEINGLGRSGRIKLPPGVAEGRPSHDGKRHGPDGATGPGVDAGSRWDETQGVQARQNEANWYE